MVVVEVLVVVELRTVPKTGAAYPVPAFPDSYTVTIGAGGFGSIISPAPGTDGSNSVFSSPITINASALSVVQLVVVVIWISKLCYKWSS